MLIKRPSTARLSSSQSALLVVCAGGKRVAGYICASASEEIAINDTMTRQDMSRRDKRVELMQSRAEVPMSIHCNGAAFMDKTEISGVQQPGFKFQNS